MQVCLAILMWWRGYSDPTEYLDVDLHVGDWIATNNVQVNSAEVRAILDEHIHTQRPLKPPPLRAKSRQQSSGCQLCQLQAD